MISLIINQSIDTCAIQWAPNFHPVKAHLVSHSLWSINRYRIRICWKNQNTAVHLAHKKPLDSLANQSADKFKSWPKRMNRKRQESKGRARKKEDEEEKEERGEDSRYLRKSSVSLKDLGQLYKRVAFNYSACFTEIRRRAGTKSLGIDVLCMVQELRWDRFRSNRQIRVCDFFFFFFFGGGEEPTSHDRLLLFASSSSFFFCRRAGE